MSISNLPTNLPGVPSESFPVSSQTPTPKPSFVDRRSHDQNSRDERRQFGSSHSGLSADGRELALAIDQYKIEHHRRYITCDEMLVVLRTLGYSK